MHQLHETEKTPQQHFLLHLKQATQSRHEALERNAYPAALMSADLNRERYLDILQRFYGFILPVEEQVYPWLAKLLAPVSRFQRADLLRLDLIALGMSQENIPGLPQITILPEIKSIAAAFGMVYVLEGSKLGGQFISRHVHQVLGLSPAQGLLFFQGHGRETGQYWNEFREAMANFAVHKQEQQNVVAAAAQTFDAFNYWLGSEVG